MTAEARMQPEPFERLRSALAATSRSHEFLTEYVTRVSQQHGEEDIFHRMVLGSSTSGAPPAADSVPKDFSELYNAMPPEHKTEVRRWWHETIRREAYHHDDLRRRLSWRYLV